MATVSVEGVLEIIERVNVYEKEKDWTTCYMHLNNKQANYLLVLPTFS